MAHAFAAFLGDELIVDLRGGFADRAGEVAWTEHTLCPVYSATKPIGALVIATLVERGKLDYDAPVADYWPEFAANGKGAFTVAEALSHQAGVPGFPDPIDPGLWLDPPALSVELAKLKPMWGRGEGSGYHPLTWGYIAGELVRRVSKRSLGTILREDICEPLGIDFWIGLPESEHDRVAQLLKPKAAAQFSAQERSHARRLPHAMGRGAARRDRMAQGGNPVRQRPRHGGRAGASLFRLRPQGPHRRDARHRTGDMGRAHARARVRARIAFCPAASRSAPA